MKRRTINPEIQDFMEKLLIRDGIPYDNSEFGKLGTALSSKDYHMYVKRARCLAQKGNRNIPVLSAEDALDAGYKRPHAFELLKGDSDKYLAAVTII